MADRDNTIKRAWALTLCSTSNKSMEACECIVEQIWESIPATSPAAPAGEGADIDDAQLEGMARKLMGAIATERSGKVELWPAQYRFALGDWFKKGYRAALACPASQSTVSEEQIMEACRPFAKNGGRWPSDWVDACCAVLALASQAQAERKGESRG